MIEDEGELECACAVLVDYLGLEVDAVKLVLGHEQDVPEAAC
jgi:hypothetical protein